MGSESQTTRKHRRFLAARLIYVGLVLLATLADLHFPSNLSAASDRLRRAFTLDLSWGDAVDGLRNLAPLGGLGLVWVVTTQSGKLRREILWGTLAGFALSVTVEGLQVFT